jgi:hypothetical protein
MPELKAFVADIKGGQFGDERSFICGFVCDWIGLHD